MQYNPERLLAFSQITNARFVLIKCFLFESVRRKRSPGFLFSGHQFGLHSGYVRHAASNDDAATSGITTASNDGTTTSNVTTVSNATTAYDDATTTHDDSTTTSNDATASNDHESAQFRTSAGSKCFRAAAATVPGSLSTDVGQGRAGRNPLADGG